MMHLEARGVYCTFNHRLLYPEMAAGCPVCIRYNEEYAVRVGTGAWRARKHKPLAEATQREWRRLRRERGRSAWVRHAPLRDKALERATKLAVEAMCGAECERAIT